MPRYAWLLLLIALPGCVSRGASSQYMNTNNQIPRSYLTALAREEGISEEEARQKVMDARGKLGAVTMADIQAGRVPGKHGPKEPAGPRKVRLQAK